MIALDTPLAFAETVQGTESDGEIVVLDLENEKFFGLNETGSRLWQELERGQTLTQTLATLASEFDVAPEILRADVLRLVEQWSAKGWLQARPQVLAP